MLDKEYRFECLNKFSELSKHNKTPQKESLLNLFATYVYLTNPDYKYNETYLKDMITDFFNNVEKYTSKVEFRENVLSEIQKYKISKDIKCQLSVQIDETWELRFDNLTKESTGKWKSTISESPKINSVNIKKTYVKCQFNNDKGCLFSDYLVSEDAAKLKKFVTDSVEFFLDRLEG